MGNQPAPPYAFGQLFSKDTQAIFYNFKLNPIQVSNKRILSMQHHRA